MLKWTVTSAFESLWTRRCAPFSTYVIEPAARRSSTGTAWLSCTKSREPPSGSDSKPGNVASGPLRRTTARACGARRVGLSLNETPPTLPVLARLLVVGGRSARGAAHRRSAGPAARAAATEEAAPRFRELGPAPCAEATDGARSAKSAARARLREGDPIPVVEHAARNPDKHAGIHLSKRRPAPRPSAELRELGEDHLVVALTLVLLRERDLPRLVDDDRRALR